MCSQRSPHLHDYIFGLRRPARFSDPIPPCNIHCMWPLLPQNPSSLRRPCQAATCFVYSCPIPPIPQLLFFLPSNPFPDILYLYPVSFSPFTPLRLDAFEHLTSTQLSATIFAHDIRFIKMGSIVAGSTYLIAPPPPKSFSHNHFIAHLLCYPNVHPLLLQLQRKDPDSKHALPQFDLVGKRTEKRQDPVASWSSDTPAPRPREVTVQHSDTGDRVATIKYINALSAGQKRKAGIAPGDTTAIAVVYWNYTKSLTKVWTVHRYESKRKDHRVGYELRLRTDLLRGRDGKGYAYVRWTRKLSPRVQSRPTSMASPGDRRSSSFSSSDMPKRRNTFPAPSPRKPAIPSEPKWEFSSPNVRRIVASMTSQKLHIHSVSSLTSPVPSPSASDVDEELHNDRELTPGRMMEILIISAFFIGVEENFAAKLRKDFLSVGGLRIPPSDDFLESPHHEPSPPSPKRVRTMSSVNSGESVRVYSRSAPSSALPSPIESSHEPNDVQFSPARTLSRKPTITTVGYATKGWGYWNSAVACVKGLLSTRP